MHEECDRTYRLRPYFRNVALTFTPVFLCFWIGSVIGAYFGALAQPQIAVIMFSAFWGSWTLLGVWLIVAYFKNRLVLNGTTLHHVVFFHRKNIATNAVQNIKWRAYPISGSCVISSLGMKHIPSTVETTLRKSSRMITSITFPVEGPF